MSTKRRDNKGRILFQGESQEENGRYKYRYMDAFGKRNTIYSWRLTEADPVPPGRKWKPSLREREQKIMSLTLQGVKGSDFTVLQLVDRYQY